MKKSIFVFLALCFFTGTITNAQLSLKKVTNSVTSKVLGTPEETQAKKTVQPEPNCACSQPEMILELTGKMQIDYTELNISTMDDGSILFKDKISGKFFIMKDDVTKGPYSEGDPEVAKYAENTKDETGGNPLLIKYKDYLSKTGDKYLITFNGKKYGPYGQINNFVVTRSKEKFAALVVENVVTTEDQGKKIEEAIKNAKTDQERMELAMKYSQEMQQKMMSGGGPTSILPKLITNIQGTSYDPSTGGTLNGNMKYDDILVNTIDGITDLKGNKVMSIKPEYLGVSTIFINSANTKYAVEGYGTLSFSDNTGLSDLFNVRFIKTDGKVYLAYMYFSPKNNAIMQCRMLF
jgi:hypothetical protein